MRKVHTRVKRKHRLPTHRKHRFYFSSVVRKKRPKTFATEESAHKWAEQNKLKKGTYSLKKVKKNKRFQIVQIS